MAKKRGIDMSEYQKSSTINYSRLSKSVDFVILRSSRGNKTIDKEFLNHVENCKKHKIPILGVYHFLYTTNTDDARQEAADCISFVKKAGLPKTTIIFADFEYDTVKKAAAKGIKLGKKECVAHTKAFCEYCEKEGYPVGIYSNIDYRKNMYTDALINKYIFWLADYTGGPDYPCEIQQFSSKGRVDGYSGDLDMDYLTATNFSKKKSGTYVVNKKAHMRSNAGIGFNDVIILPKNSVVKCTGFYSKSSAKNVWLYASADVDGKHYEGFIVESKLTKK